MRDGYVERTPIEALLTLLFETESSGDMVKWRYDEVQLQGSGPLKQELFGNLLGSGMAFLR